MLTEKKKKRTNNPPKKPVYIPLPKVYEAEDTQLGSRQQ